MDSSALNPLLVYDGAAMKSLGDHNVLRKIGVRFGWVKSSGVAKVLLAGLPAKSCKQY